MSWKGKPGDVDYHLYLPIFFDGLREKKDPYRFIAISGCIKLLNEGKGKILHVVP